MVMTSFEMINLGANAFFSFMTVFLPLNVADMYLSYDSMKNVSHYYTILTTPITDNFTRDDRDSEFWSNTWYLCYIYLTLVCVKTLLYLNGRTFYLYLRENQTKSLISDYLSNKLFYKITVDNPDQRIMQSVSRSAESVAKFTMEITNNVLKLLYYSYQAFKKSKKLEHLAVCYVFGIVSIAANYVFTNKLKESSKNVDLQEAKARGQAVRVYKSKEAICLADGEKVEGNIWTTLVEKLINSQFIMALIFGINSILTSYISYFGGVFSYLRVCKKQLSAKAAFFAYLQIMRTLENLQFGLYIISNTLYPMCSVYLLCSRQRRKLGRNSVTLHRNHHEHRLPIDFDSTKAA